MKFLSYLRKIDIFGRRVELRLDKKKKHKTYCGAFATLFILFFTIVIAWIYITQFIKYDNPFLRIYTLSQEDYIDINKSNNLYGMNLMIQLVDKSTNKTLGQDSFVLVANQYKVDDQTNTQSLLKQTLFQQCVQDASQFCLPQGTSVLLTPFNQDGDEKQLQQYLQIRIYDCIQWAQISGQTGNCLSQTSINNLKTSSEAILLFNQYQVNPKDFSNPITTVNRIHIHQLINSKNSAGTIDQVALYFQEVIVSTDKGWVWEDYQNNNLVSYYSISGSSLSVSDSSLLEFDIQIQNQKQFIERTYSKIQVYLAYIGGIIKMLMIVGECLTKPFVRLSLSIKIVNEVFDFEGGVSEDGSQDLLSYEEIYQDHGNNTTKNNNNDSLNKNQVQTLNIFHRASSQYSIGNQRSSSPTVQEAMISSIGKQRNPSITKSNGDPYDQSVQPGNLIKMQKTENSITEFGVIQQEFKRNRNISIIHEHQHDMHSVSTLQNVKRQSRDIASPITSVLGMKKFSQNGSSNKQSKTSLDFLNSALKESSQGNCTVHTEDASPSHVQRSSYIKQTFQPINITISSEGQNKVFHSQKFTNHVNSVTNLPNNQLANLEQFVDGESPQSSFSSSSSSSQSSQQFSNSERSNNKQTEERKNKFSSSLPNSPKTNELKTTKQPSPSYNQHKNEKMTFPNPNIFLPREDVCIMEPKQRKSQKITGDIEEKITTPNYLKLVSESLGQNIIGQMSTSKQNFLSVDSKHNKISQNLSTEQSPQFKRNKSILKNGNAANAIRHSYSAGDNGIVYDGNQQISEVQTPLRRQNMSITFENNGDKSQIIDEKSGQKSDTASLRQSPNIHSRMSGFSSPERESISSPQNKVPIIKNLQFLPYPPNVNGKPNGMIERRSKSVLTITKPRNFKQPENILTKQNFLNPNQSQDRDNIRTRNSSQYQNRHSSKRFSCIDHQKMYAASQLISDQLNHQETPLQALKDFQKLAQSPKKKIKNADSIFKKLFRQGKVLKMRIFDYITFYLQCFKKIYSEKKKQIRFSKQKVKERLDVVYIMQKLVEIDKLKMLVLNDDQIKLFEYLPKPIVHLNPKDIPSSPGLRDKNKSPQIHQQPQNMQQAWSMLHQQKKPIEKATEASVVYKNLIEADELQPIDRKLIDMIDVRIKNIFEQQIFNQRQHAFQSEANNSVFRPNVPNTEQVNITQFDNNITRENPNDTNLPFLDTQQHFKTNNSQLMERRGNQDRKSLDDINPSKIDIQTSFNFPKKDNIDTSNQISSKDKNQFFFEIQVTNHNGNSEQSEQKKRLNSINIVDQKQIEQIQNSLNSNIYSNKDQKHKKSERIY